MKYFLEVFDINAWLLLFFLLGLVVLLHFFEFLMNILIKVMVVIGFFCWDVDPLICLCCTGQSKGLWIVEIFSRDYLFNIVKLIFGSLLIFDSFLSFFLLDGYDLVLSI